ncbi:MAG TPA: DUF3877 family protein [Mobilitalea sp.]|nr:DUF3877 family protein [Mobilitalea sp.]
MKANSEEFKENDFTELRTNLEAMLHESFVKIGYVSGQSIGIYYTEELLCHLLAISIQNPYSAQLSEQILGQLDKFTKENEPLWGNILYSEENGRYKLTVPPQGLDYVYERNKDNHFLEELIAKLASFNVTIDDITAVFYHYSNDVICEKSQDDEFEYAVHFADNSIDPFIYCFTFDEMGRYYHRFTEFDYRNLLESHN